MSELTTVVKWGAVTPLKKSRTAPLDKVAFYSVEYRGKRIFDLLFTVLILPLLAPFLLVIPLAIWWESGRPVFFRHRRLGKGGCMFDAWKFRTMVNGADKLLHVLLQNDPCAKREFAETCKLRKDPRITRVGLFLRHTSLDELPQVWNVLKGEMTWVGPRPIVEAELAKYESRAAKLLSVKPGVTGLWQVSGRSDLSYRERVKLDMQYIDGPSFWLDLKVILRTAVAVFTQRGAL
jgi:exopolysaccharide production protein ExoY